MSETTQIFDSIQRVACSDELLPLVYEELRKLAAQKMAGEALGHTLQPTALVHEAWLRLAQSGDQRWNSRGHFFASAAEAMRRILIERARARHRLKHGGGLHRTQLTTLDIAITAEDDSVLAVDEALEKLAQRDPVGAQLIKLRFFAGLSNVEAGTLLGLPERTAKRTWAYARAWLYEELKRTWSE